LYWTTVGVPSGVIVRGGDGDGVQWTYNCSFSMAVLSKSNVVTFCPLTTAMAPIAPVAVWRYLFNQVNPLADSRLVEVNEKLGSIGRLDLSAVTRQTSRYILRAPGMHIRCPRYISTYLDAMLATLARENVSYLRSSKRYFTAVSRLTLYGRVGTH
jgi:hypothetical protein